MAWCWIQLCQWGKQNYMKEWRRRRGNKSLQPRCFCCKSLKKKRKKKSTKPRQTLGAIWSRLWASEIHTSRPQRSAADMSGIDYRKPALPFSYSSAVWLNFLFAVYWNWALKWKKPTGVGWGGKWGHCRRKTTLNLHAASQDVDE